MKISIMLPVLIICILVLALSLTCINPTKESKPEYEPVVIDTNYPLSITVRDWNHYTVSFSEADINAMIQQSAILPENVDTWVDLSAQKLYVHPNNLKFNPIASCSFQFLATGSDLIINIKKAKIGQLPIPLKFINRFLTTPIPTSLSLSQYVDTKIPIDFNHVELSSNQLHIDCLLSEGKMAKLVQSSLKKLTLPSQITTDDVFSSSLVPTELDHAVGKIDNAMIDTVANGFLAKHLSQNVSSSPANYMVQTATVNMTDRTILLNGTWLGFPINPLIGFNPKYDDNAIQFDVTSLTFGTKSTPDSVIRFVKSLIGEIKLPLSLLSLPNYCEINHLDFKPTYLEFTYSVDIEGFVEALNNNPEEYQQYVAFAKELGDKSGQFGFTLPYATVMDGITSYTQISRIKSDYFKLKSIDLLEEGILNAEIIALDIPIIFETKMNAYSLNNRIAFSCQDINLTIAGFEAPSKSINAIFPQDIHFDIPSVPLIEQYGFNLSDVTFEDTGLRLLVTLNE